MKAIRVLPAKHQAPTCEAYDDEREVRRFERAMREHRAYAEVFRVVPLDERVDGTYRVTGASGSAYHVDIVDRSGSHDACSCADFLSNELGTCKHLEVVRRAIARVPGLERAFHRLREVPRGPVLTVRATGSATLRATGPACLVAIGPWEKDDLRRLGLARDPREPEVVVPDPRRGRIVRCRRSRSGKRASLTPPCS
jgi:hypothetical protein